jgi:hypothetical protein
MPTAMKNGEKLFVLYLNINGILITIDGKKRKYL